MVARNVVVISQLLDHLELFWSSEDLATNPFRPGFDSQHCQMSAFESLRGSRNFLFALVLFDEIRNLLRTKKGLAGGYLVHCDGGRYLPGFPFITKGKGRPGFAFVGWGKLKNLLGAF